MAKRSCEWCGETFKTLTEERLHECPQKHEKMSENLTLEGLGYTQEGDPLAVFTVEIPEGKEWGQYKLALGYAEVDGEGKFVFLDGENNIVAELDADPEVIEWLDTAIDRDCYITATNYEPSDEYGNDEIEYFAIAGRATGKMFDHVDREEFTPENRDRIKQIREELAGPREDVIIGEMDDGPNFREPLDTSDAEPVVELAIAGNPDREPRVIDTKENIRGLSKLLLVKHGFDTEANRPINVVPLTPDIGRTYVRLIFDNEETAANYFENFEAVSPDDELINIIKAMVSVDA